MDREHFRARVRELRSCAEFIGPLTQMPAQMPDQATRATQKDFQQAAELLAGAAADIEELIETRLPGCPCRRIQGENYGHLAYVEGCLHHGPLYVMHERLKADYETMEKTLKNEVRMKLVAAALTGAALHGGIDHESDVRRALDIADEVLRLLARETA